ncbi:restriction endonuclease [Streptosporangium sp. NPDC051023]|uniref:restriction endonuclease n=1 Tax=Streptosporangium sp. NPDC051023 TaxID=3155410 RepID=UPI00344BEE3F
MRLSRPRMPANSMEWCAAAVVAVVAGSFVVRGIQTAVDLILSRWYIGVPVGLCALVAITVWAWWGVTALRRRADRLRGVRLTLSTLDAMSPIAFEWAVRDLMVRDGIAARHVGQRGDKAADVIGRDLSGYVIVAQCKHTTTAAKVGARVIYEVNGTAHPVHKADVAVVVTNGSFTRDARRSADDFQIHLIGREELHRWAGGAVSLQGLLRLTTPLRRWRRLRRTPSLLIRHGSTPERTPRAQR